MSQKRIPDAPGRRPMISRDFLLDARRARFAAAAAEIVEEFGLGGASVTNVVRLGGGSRGSFYEVFPNVGACLEFGILMAYRRLFEDLGAGTPEDGWAARVEVAVRTLYGRVAEEPVSAALYLVHSHAIRTGPERRGPWEGAVALEGLLAAGRVAAGRRVPDCAEEYWASAVLEKAARALRAGEVAALPGQAGAMSALAVGAYLGGPATRSPMPSRD